MSSSARLRIRKAADEPARPVTVNEDDPVSVSVSFPKGTVSGNSFRTDPNLPEGLRMSVSRCIDITQSCRQHESPGLTVTGGYIRLMLSYRPIYARTQQTPAI